MPENPQLIDGDFSFRFGMQSSVDPSTLKLGYYYNSINMLNVGDLLSCRPGYRCVSALPKGKLQGAALFKPALGLEQILIVIDGVVYVATYPFEQFHFLPNVLMSPTAKQIYFQQATQSARRRTADLGSAIELIPPREVIFIQDGGFTAPAYYDGAESGHIRDQPFETPAGGAMAWTGDRLWVAVGRTVFASDIANPFSFREQIYLGGVQGFRFSGDVTAMIESSSTQFPQLFVFTETDMSILQANVRNRALWPTIDNFQMVVLKVGAVGQRSVMSHFGRIYWMSPAGFTWFDSATASGWTSRAPVRDNEMHVSKVELFEDLSLCAGAVFGNFVLMSVPFADLFNKHTWVLNNAALETINDDSGPSWASVWLGTRPVEWVFGQIAGAERIYHVSADEDCENRLWEAFRPERLDNGSPIMWAVEPRAYFGTIFPNKTPGRNSRFRWADVALVCIEEDLELGVFFAGGLRGAYKTILAKLISVSAGSVCTDCAPICNDTVMCGWKGQVRIERTQDVAQMPLDNETGTCAIESEHHEDIDDAFQLLIVGHGPASIRYIRAFSLLEQEDPNGEPRACEDEHPFQAIRFDGSGAQHTNCETMQAELAAKFISWYSAVKSISLTSGGVTAVGTGMSESIISQAAADRVAERVAIKSAEKQIECIAPPILSIGEGIFTEDSCREKG